MKLYRLKEDFRCRLFTIKKGSIVASKPSSDTPRGYLRVTQGNIEFTVSRSLLDQVR